MMTDRLFEGVNSACMAPGPSGCDIPQGRGAYLVSVIALARNAGPPGMRFVQIISSCIKPPGGH